MYAEEEEGRQRFIEDIERAVDRRLTRGHLPRSTALDSRGVQTEKFAGSTEAGVQTDIEDPAALLEGIKRASVWIAKELQEGRAVHPEGVVAIMPTLTILEGEGIIVAVGTGLAAAGLPAATTLIKERIPAVAVRNVCLIAVNKEGSLTPPEAGLMPPPPVPPAVATTSKDTSQGKPLTAAVVTKAERRARGAREKASMPYQLPPSSDEEAKRRHLSLLFQGRDTEAFLLRKKYSK
jgi:hypothetical protein